MSRVWVSDNQATVPTTWTGPKLVNMPEQWFPELLRIRDNSLPWSAGNLAAHVASLPAVIAARIPSGFAGPVSLNIEYLDLSDPEADPFIQAAADAIRAARPGTTIGIFGQPVLTQLGMVDWVPITGYAQIKIYVRGGPWHSGEAAFSHWGEVWSSRWAPAYESGKPVYFWTLLNAPFGPVSSDTLRQTLSAMRPYADRIKGAVLWIGNNNAEYATKARSVAENMDYWCAAHWPAYSPP